MFSLEKHGRTSKQFIYGWQWLVSNGQVPGQSAAARRPGWEKIPVDLPQPTEQPIRNIVEKESCPITNLQKQTWKPKVRCFHTLPFVRQHTKILKIWCWQHKIIKESSEIISRHSHYHHSSLSSSLSFSQKLPGRTSRPPLRLHSVPSPSATTSSDAAPRNGRPGSCRGPSPRRADGTTFLRYKKKKNERSKMNNNFCYGNFWWI